MQATRQRRQIDASTTKNLPEKNFSTKHQNSITPSACLIRRPCSGAAKNCCVRQLYCVQSAGAESSQEISLSSPPACCVMPTESITAHLRANT